MNVCSIEFVLLLVLASAIFFWIPGVLPRQVALAACNLAFLSSLISDSTSWTALIVFLGSGYLTIRMLQAFPHVSIVSAHIIFLVAGFMLLKRYEYLAPIVPRSWLEHTIAVVGLSYMLFRQIHVVVDVFEGQIPAISLWSYLNYQLRACAKTHHAA